jgi:hypothetical protein
MYQLERHPLDATEMLIARTEKGLAPRLDLLQEQPML